MEDTYQYVRGFCTKIEKIQYNIRVTQNFVTNCNLNFMT